MFSFRKKMDGSIESSQVFKNNKHCYFHLEGVPKVTIVPSSSKIQILDFFGKIDGSFQKKPTENFRKRWFGQVFWATWILPLLMSSQDVKKFGFLGKGDGFFFENDLQVFKNTQRGYFPSESVSKVILAYAISRRSNLEMYWKQWCFLSKNSLKVFRSTMFGIFYLECASDFEIAWEFSKQSNFWVFRRNRCCPWKDPRFFPKSVNVASFF